MNSARGASPVSPPHIRYDAGEAQPRSPKHTLRGGVSPPVRSAPLHAARTPTFSARHLTVLPRTQQARTPSPPERRPIHVACIQQRVVRMPVRARRVPSTTPLCAPCGRHLRAPREHSRSTQRPAQPLTRPRTHRPQAVRPPPLCASRQLPRSGIWCCSGSACCRRQPSTARWPRGWP